VISTEDTGTWTPVMELDELWEGEMIGVTAGTAKVLLVNADGDIRAYENRCPHQAWALDEGEFDGEKIICSRHLWEFEPLSGNGINPNDCSLKSFPCRVDEDGMICVSVP
jgi:Ferredoxin subunits of nitrite reductase and ring-hydroxylating dioxygenases